MPSASPVHGIVELCCGVSLTSVGGFADVLARFGVEEMLGARVLAEMAPGAAVPKLGVASKLDLRAAVAENFDFALTPPYATFWFVLIFIAPTETAEAGMVWRRGEAGTSPGRV